jgi:hypothetical protein
MKSSAPDGKLKSSDIVRADRIPGFEANLLRTTVRVTQSGWASCFVSTWSPETGSVEASFEHRFGVPDLVSIRESLERVSVVIPERITCDDIPTQRLVFISNSHEISVQFLGSVDKMEVLEIQRYECRIPAT